MKIQLPLENWSDLLPFVPSNQLVRIASRTADRQFASILQFFLHEYAKFTLGHMEIVAARKKGTAILRQLLEIRPGFAALGPKIALPDMEMSKNVNNFQSIVLRYVDVPIINFLQKFQQNGLLANVNLSILERRIERLGEFTGNLLPLIDSINSIQLMNADEILREIYNPSYKYRENGCAELLETLMAMPTFLEARVNYSVSIVLGLHWFYHWLNTTRIDGKPRMLIITTPYRTYPSDVSELIDRIKQDFLMAQQAIGFFIRLKMSRDVLKELALENISILENDQTNEKLTIKVRESNASRFEKILLISRHPMNATKEWIETKEKEILGWIFDEQNRHIRLCPRLRSYKI